MHEFDVPALGANVPRRGNRFTRYLGVWMLRRKGWRIVGSIPDVPKAIIIAAPHTSNWDGYFAMAVLFALQIRANVMAKHSLFRWPFARLLRWIGFIPINRDTSRGMVEQTVAIFHRKEQLMLAIAPEGTRGNAAQWKTGFYHIAMQAQVPIILASLDYGRREVCFDRGLVPSGDIDADLQCILEFYRGKAGRHPHRLSAPLRALRPPDAP